MEETPVGRRPLSEVSVSSVGCFALAERAGRALRGKRGSLQAGDGQEGGHGVGHVLDAEFVRRHDEVIQAGVAQVGVVEAMSIRRLGVISPVDEAQGCRGLRETG